MIETNTSNQQNISSTSTVEDHSHDYKYALILGIIIGLALIPTVYNLDVPGKLGVGGFSLYIYIGLLFAMPLLALAGIFVARLLVQRITVLWQFAKFGLIGVSNTALNFGVFNFFIYLTGITKGFALSTFSAMAFLVALVNSYIWNSHWSFKNDRERTPKEFFQFFAVTFCGLLINSVVVYSITQYMAPLAGVNPKVWANVANLVATLIVMFWNFTGFKFLVFKK